MLKVGLPAGVLNLVCGLGHKAGEALVTHPDVKILSFTGSTLIGQRIASLAGRAWKSWSQSYKFLIYKYNASVEVR
jgi:acyl-CoA reductase-like NAD-dependent aldehyde dehydrogenase